MLRLLTVLWLLLPALTFFEKNSQRYTQWRRVRRNGGYTAGQMTFHSYEAPLGRTVLAAATYLLTRTTPGSYHWLFDAMRKHIHLAPWSAETWHSVPTNNWAASASAVMYASDWRRLNAAKPGTQLHTYRQNIIYGFALASAEFSRWLISQGRNPVPKRVLTRAQAMRKEDGFIFHRDTDPGRRSDPADPRGEFPWDEFFVEYDRLLGGAKTPTTVQEDDMPLTESEKREIKSWIDTAAENVLLKMYDTGAAKTAEAVATFTTATEPRSLWTMLRRATDAAQATNAALPQIAGKVGASINTDELAAGLAGPLTEALAGSVSGEVVESALRRVFADAATPNQEA